MAPSAPSATATQLEAPGTSHAVAPVEKRLRNTDEGSLQAVGLCAALLPAGTAIHKHRSQRAGDFGGLVDHPAGSRWQI